MDVLVSFDHRADDLEDMPVAALAAYVLEAEGKPEACEVSVAFVDDETMAQLNGSYRGMEGPTDVLSFECDPIDDEVSAAASPEAPYELGDVIIAPDVAQRQAAAYGQSFEQELELLLVHGLLHLCGYDHIEEADAVVMEAREEELLRAWRAEATR